MFNIFDDDGPPADADVSSQASREQARHLSLAKKATARAHARRAGRRYPNLVDKAPTEAIAGSKKQTVMLR